MRLVFLTALGIVAAISPITTFAQTQSFDGVAVVAAGSLNPPNPNDRCAQAKADAIKKAASAGFSRLVKWERLSNDSECSLSMQGAAGRGYFFIFTAKGTFSK